MNIRKIQAFEILDSRGNPSIMTEVILSNGIKGTASVPSGASTGTNEAKELRDGDERYNGLGVHRAICNIKKEIAPCLKALNTSDLFKVDSAMIELDGTNDKSRLGANAMLSVSLATARANAASYGMPLFRYLGGVSAVTMPVPMMNILNGGAHASNNVDIQEFMIAPIGAESFSEAIRMCSEIYKALGKLLKKRGISCGVGDEGGFAPSLQSDEEALELICQAIENARYSTNEVKIALDAAASEWQESSGNYTLKKSRKTFSTQELISYWEDLCKKYPIYSIEDALGENDWNGWRKLTSSLGTRIQLVGDDLFVTNRKYLEKGFEMNAANAILIKYNQIGTLSETIDTIRTARHKGYKTIISHRSGETEDVCIADLCVALNAGQIKSGAPCRSDRTAKYNRLLRIEAFLGENSVYTLS